MHMSINQMKCDTIVCMRSWRASQHSSLVYGTPHYKVLLRDFPAATSLISSAVKVSYLRSASASCLCSEAQHWRMWWARLYDSWSEGERGIARRHGGMRGTGRGRGRTLRARKLLGKSEQEGLKVDLWCKWHAQDTLDDRTQSFSAGRPSEMWLLEGRLMNLSFSSTIAIASNWGFALIKFLYLSN